MARPAKNGFKFPMTRGEVIAGLCFLAVYVLALPTLFQLIFRIAWPNASDTAFTAAVYLFSFVVVLLIMHRYLRLSFNQLLDAKLNAVSTLVLAYVGFYLISYLVSLLLFSLGAGENPNDAALFEHIRLDTGRIIAINVLLAPLVEETLFRGLVFGGLRKKSRLAAYIVSFALFAFYHTWHSMTGGFTWSTLLTAVEYLPAALALCWSYERSGSVWCPIILHGLINVVSISIALG